MGKVKLFPTAEYTSKQPRDPIVPRVPCAGIFLGPSKSGKTVALISAILDQYMTSGGESVFERIYIFSPSIEIDDAWKPVKDFIEHRMGVNTEREQVYFDKWDEGALWPFQLVKATARCSLTEGSNLSSRRPWQST